MKEPDFEAMACSITNSALPSSPSWLWAQTRNSIRDALRAAYLAGQVAGLKEGAATDDLETAATQYAINTPNERICPACAESTAWPVDKHAFLAGASWQRERDAKDLGGKKE